MSSSHQSWYRRSYAPVLIVLGMIALVMAVLSITQRDNAGNEPIPAPKKTTTGSSVAAVS